MKNIPEEPHSAIVSGIFEGAAGAVLLVSTLAFAAAAGLMTSDARRTALTVKENLLFNNGQVVGLQLIEDVAAPLINVGNLLSAVLLLLLVALVFVYFKTRFKTDSLFGILFFGVLYFYRSTELMYQTEKANVLSEVYRQETHYFVSVLVLIGVLWLAARIPLIFRLMLRRA